MKNRKRMSIEQTANVAACSHWTVRRYLKLGVISGLKDKQGTWSLDPDTPAKIRQHLEQHGGPGGRPLLARQ